MEVLVLTVHIVTSKKQEVCVLGPVCWTSMEVVASISVIHKWPDRGYPKLRRRSAWTAEHRYLGPGLFHTDRMCSDFFEAVNHWAAMSIIFHIFLNRVRKDRCCSTKNVAHNLCYQHILAKYEYQEEKSAGKDESSIHCCTWAISSTGSRGRKISSPMPS